MIPVAWFSHHNIIVGMNIIIIQVGSHAVSSFAQTGVHHCLGEKQHIPRGADDHLSTGHIKALIL